MVSPCQLSILKLNELSCQYVDVISVVDMKVLTILAQTFYIRSSKSRILLNLKISVVTRQYELCI